MQYDESSVEAGIRKLVYGITHDMSGPLRAVIQFSTLLQQKLDDRLDDKERYWLELIHQGGVEAQQMLDALLVYSRLTPTPEDEGVVSLEAIIQQSLKQLPESNQSYVDVELSTDNTAFQSYPRLWQCLVNEALSNACKFHPQDSEHQPKVLVSLCSNEEQQKLSIDDNGIGISEGNLSAVSTPYKKLNGTEYEGNGMGLSYIDRICDITSATYSLRQSDLGGLKFEILIPK